MKRKIFTMLAAALICAFTGAACAQSEMHLRAAVPFQFIAEGKVLSPGVYDVKELEPSLIVLQNMSDHSAAIAPTRESRPEKGMAGKATLVFHRYGNTYFLTQVTLENSDEARQLGISSEEKKLADARTRPQLVVVNLSFESASSSGK
jgi:hypothetical protein